MCNELKKLYTKIQHSRAVLHALLYSNNLSDDIVLSCSKDLDNLIAQYEKTKLNLYKRKNLI